MTEDKLDIDRLLADAARTPAENPSPDLMQRVLNDAVALQPAAPAPASPSRARRPGSALMRGLRMLGGWPSVAGLSVAALAGVWIGFTDNLLMDEVDSVFDRGSYYLSDFQDGSAFFVEEG